MSKSHRNYCIMEVDEHFNSKPVTTVNLIYSSFPHDIKYGHKRPLDVTCSLNAMGLLPTGHITFSIYLCHGLMYLIQRSHRAA